MIKQNFIPDLAEVVYNDKTVKHQKLGNLIGVLVSYKQTIAFNLIAYSGQSLLKHSLLDYISVAILNPQIAENLYRCL